MRSAPRAIVRTHPMVTRARERHLNESRLSSALHRGRAERRGVPSRRLLEGRRAQRLDDVRRGILAAPRVEVQVSKDFTVEP
jgi:hypothetical protein